MGTARGTHDIDVVTGFPFVVVGCAVRPLCPEIYLEFPSIFTYVCLEEERAGSTQAFRGGAEKLIVAGKKKIARMYTCLPPRHPSLFTGQRRENMSGIMHVGKYSSCSSYLFHHL